jgi:hypothetical protein
VSGRTTVCESGSQTLGVTDERAFGQGEWRADEQRLSSRGIDDKPAETADVPVLTERVEQLPRGAGWLLITAGVAGLVVPGVPGTPFLLAGAIVLTPGGSRLLSRWVGRNPPEFVRSAMRQISRFLDDLERRYPRTRSPRPTDETNRTSEAR